MKKNYKIALAFILGILVSGTSVYAATKYLASDVKYKDKTVEDALNELYNQSGSSCSESLVGATWSFNYSGEETKFKIPCDGTYKLETWGAQGGNYNSSLSGGYGAYAVGNVELSHSTDIYINIGGQGSVTNSSPNQVAKGGYNGGGNGMNNPTTDARIATGGGGATHLALKSGLLSSFENDLDKLLIVSAGGSGTWSLLVSSDYRIHSLGHAGGISGVQGIGYNKGPLVYSKVPNQKTGYAFGIGQSVTSGEAAGAGGGLYGGYVTSFAASGGSSYIGNVLLKEKVMYCYNCTQSSEESTKTISTTNVSGTPTSNYAKTGHGYAKITLVSLK